MANLSRTKLTAGSLVLLASTTASMALPDVVLCELYSLSQFGTSGSVRALALATTSWNIGDSDLPWMQNPDPQHPVIGMNMYRLDNDRFEQIGVSWLKHGFFALGDLQCDDSGLPNCVYESGHGIGDYLGQGCTDTYSASLNAGGLGPRFEINPWTGAFNYNTSMFNTGGLPGNNTRRLRVEDADMNPAINPNADYFFEGYYVHFQDRNHMNKRRVEAMHARPQRHRQLLLHAEQLQCHPHLGLRDRRLDRRLPDHRRPADPRRRGNLARRTLHPGL